MEFKNLKELFSKFKDEATCREYLAQRRWGGKPICPKCGCSKTYVIEGGKRYKCANKECFRKFSVTVGTFCENSNIPLSTWFPAIYLITSHKGGITSVQLAKHLGVRQKTAWFMEHRIREALKDKGSKLLGNVVEADETFVGGTISNKHNKVRAEWAINKNKRENKQTVFSMIERGGMVVTQHVTAPTGDNVLPVMKERIAPTSVVVTDTSKIYHKLGKLFEHYTVNHKQNEYVRDNWYTNTIEGFFSQLQRTIYGTYIAVSSKHLQRYCDEVSYRYNTRDLKDPIRFSFVLSNFEGRLTYNQLIQNNGKGKKIFPKAKKSS